MEKYNFKKWSYADRKMYRQIFTDITYDKEIQEFFEEQKRFEDRWAKRYEKYLTLFTDLPVDIDYYSGSSAFDSIVIDKIAFIAIIKAISSLPVLQKRRFYLKHIKQYRQQEVAEIENVSVRAVTDSISRARRNLIKKLKLLL